MTNQEIIELASRTIEREVDGIVDPTWTDEDLIQWAKDAQKDFLLKISPKLLDFLYTVSDEIVTSYKDEFEIDRACPSDITEGINFNASCWLAQKFYPVRSYDKLFDKVIVAIYFLRVGLAPIEALLCLSKDEGMTPAFETPLAVQILDTVGCSNWKKFIFPNVRLPVEEPVWIVLRTSSTVPWRCAFGAILGGLLLTSTDQGVRWRPVWSEHVGFHNLAISLIEARSNILPLDCLKIVEVLCDGKICKRIDVGDLHNSLYAGTKEFPSYYLLDRELIFTGEGAEVVRVTYIKNPKWQLNDENGLLPEWHHIFEKYIVAKALEKDKQYEISRRYFQEFNDYIALLNSKVA